VTLDGARGVDGRFEPAVRRPEVPTLQILCGLLGTVVRGVPRAGGDEPTSRPTPSAAGPCSLPVRVRRLLACFCQIEGEATSFGVLDLGHDAVAPELAYVTARYAALAPFGKVAVLMSELLPIGGAQNAGTVRNRSRRVGEKVVRQHATEMATQTATPPDGPVVVGLDGGYVRSRHRQQERHFEVIAGKVIDAAGTQHRFAFARNGQAGSAEAFAQALAAAGVHADTPATVLCDGDAGLWRLQRETLPAATVALDWWHVAIRFEHALQTARGLGAGAADPDFADEGWKAQTRENAR
jgi:hypothetical protein